MAFRPFARRHGRGCPVSETAPTRARGFCSAGANYNQIRARPRWGRLVPHPPLGTGRMPSLGRG